MFPSREPLNRRRTAAPDQKKSRHHEVDVSSGTQLFSWSMWEEGLKERDIRNVTFDFSPGHGDDDDVNRHAVVEKRKTCGTKEFGPSQRSAGSLAGVQRHDPVTVKLEATRSADPALPVAETTPSEEKAIAERSHAPTPAEDPLSFSYLYP